MEITFAGASFDLIFWIPFVVWVLALVVYTVFSAVLVYHWNKYALNNPTVKLIRRLYFSVTPIFLLLSVLSLAIAFYV